MHCLRDPDTIKIHTYGELLPGVFTTLNIRHGCVVHNITAHHDGQSKLHLNLIHISYLYEIKNC